MSRNPALTARARRYLADAAHAFDHAPVEVSLAVVLAATFSYAVWSDAEPFREWAEIAIVIVLTIAVAFTATLVHALGAVSARSRWVITGAGAIAAALYGAFVLDLALEAEAWRAAMLMTAAALLVISAPALAGRTDATERFRRVTGRLAIRTLAVLIYAAALYAGLALALGAVNTLFELDLNAKVYLHTLAWVFFVLVPWVVAGGVPDYVRPAESAGAVGAAVHRMSAFLVTPLLAIYYIILYAYALRIAITGELPKNLVSPLVIAAGVIAGIALVLFDRTDDERPYFRSLRIAAPLFLPLCVLGLWALYMRLDQYGWTEFRALRTLLLATLGALALAAAIAVMRRRSLRLHLLPVTLTVVTALSMIGPWSVTAVSRRSQQARLEQALAAAGIDGSATAVTDTLIPNEQYRQISETTRYLNSHFGATALPPLFAQHADGTNHVDVAYVAGLRSEQPDPVMSGARFAHLSGGAVLGEGDRGTLYYVRFDRPDVLAMRRRNAAAGTAAPDTTQARTIADSMVVRIRVADLDLFADVGPIARGLLSLPPGRDLPPELSRVMLRDGNGAEVGELFVIEIGVDATGEGQVSQVEGVARLDALARSR